MQISRSVFYNLILLWVVENETRENNERTLQSQNRLVEVNCFGQ